MSTVRSLVVALSLTFCSAASDAAAAAQAPRISNLNPPPSTPSMLPPLTPAQIDNTLVIGGQDVKARLVDTRLSVEVLVNGRGPFRFVVDSGADTSVVGLRIARGLQLPIGTPAILNGMTARDVVDRVRVDQLTLGPSTINNLDLPALREVDVGGDGLIGIDALVMQRLMMDFEKRTIKVEDARLPDRHIAGEIVIVARRRRGQLILAHVSAAGLPLDAVIDTGSEVTIGNLALRDKLFRRHRNKFSTAVAVGVTGIPITLQMTRIDELQLGPVTLRDIPIAFADVPPFAAFGLRDEPALLLGTDLLANFRRVSLDFRARKVRFQLRRCKAQGFYVDTSVNERLTFLLPAGSTEACLR
ncbi:aspartyl protease [Sphingomonas sp. F9_3S_D5_B_2]